ncbi:ATP-dependent helicase HrpA [hydrothermal vent metagenome]|uniref:ATP-dependent helicase HrpA n=1 Tax=hydrothermal vent metagenome TaxID=652676 RepID=A0A3B0XCE6_9ZZZZ
MNQTPDSTQLKHLQQLISQCMLKDQYVFQRRLKTVRKYLKEHRPADQLLAQLQKQVDSSAQQYQRRKNSNPSIHYPPELPVSQKRTEILEAINRHQVIVICGETGSGKTTQLPKMCLEAGLGIRGMIGHTQPRRIAARSVASRIAEELKTEPGQVVGYKVRFSDTLGDNSLIKLMTDGVLLSEIHHDPYLNQYDCIIIDEAHERSLNIDFLLGYLKRLSTRRDDLKIIITSATIDPQRFSTHFNNAPIIEVSGRTFPVDVQYRGTKTDEDKSIDIPGAIADCVDEISRLNQQQVPGDILVFLSGERDIRETADYLSKQNLRNTEILPLLARLSASEQNRIFNPSSRQRIILSTNVAETSLTVPGIKYVIDTGVARISRYSWRSKIQRLPIESISQASANQRKGRCGRVSAGICYRLYSEEDFLLRDEFTQPEIQRTNLAAVILQLEQMQLGHVDDFPFVEPPDSRLINDGYKLLLELGAIDSTNKMTPVGKQLARLPVDPKLGRILIEANNENCLNEALVIVSALAVQNPRERPVDKQQAADEAHKQFTDKRSDFISWLNIWNKYHDAKKELSANKLRKWCKSNFISWMRMREWLDTHRQIHKMLKELNFKFNSTPADYSQIHRALLTGFFSQIGFKDEGHEYQGCRQRKFHIFPGSGLFNKGPKWVLASEIVETQKVYARSLAKIEPQWILDKANHLLKHSYEQAHWEKKSSQVAATRKSTLYGLLVDPGSKVNFGPLNPEESREIFIRHALVQGDFNCQHDFFLHNQTLVENIENLEARSRRRDILVDEEDVYEFYNQRLPDNIYSGPQLNKWLKRNKSSDLFLQEKDLMKQDSDHVTDDLFPPAFSLNTVQYPLEYHFDPGHHCDGITLITPVAGLGGLNTQSCDWLVPGLLREKVTELIRSLPKQLRKNFVPAPDFATACIEAITPFSAPLTTAISNRLKKMTGIDIPYDAWNEKNIAEHLFFNFRVVSVDGKILKQGRDLTTLQAEFADFIDSDTPHQKPHDIECDDVNHSVLDHLPEHVEINNHGILIKAWPALKADGKKVNLRVFHSHSEAKKWHWAGLRQLFMMSMSQPVRHLKSTMPNIQKLCMKYSGIGNCETLKTQIIHRLIDQLFTQHLPTSSESFKQVLDENRGDINDALNRLLKNLNLILDSYYSLHKQLKTPSLHWLDAMSDIQNQLNHLLHKNFVLSTPELILKEYPRYLKAIEKRLDKIQSNPQRDRKLRLEISLLWSDYKKRAEQLSKQNRHSEQLEDYRWLLEEYRISLFAQEIKTRVPVSAKRLKKIWNNISDA